MIVPDLRAIVMDIEGTTSSISFVHDILFPYARTKIPDYVRTHIDEIGDIIASVCQETGRENLTIEECISILLGWMDEDRKVTPLKALQGRIWAEGYATGMFKGHVFPDVAPNLQKWTTAGLKLYVYSSGSIAAQKQIFGHSEAGDLTSYFSGYFDTTTGGKKDRESYKKIAATIGVAAPHILFLSDNPDELQAARTAGYSVIGLNRPDNSFDLGLYPVVNSFDDIRLEKQHDSAA